jgi:hypothetical protein
MKTCGEVGAQTHVFWLQHKLQASGQFHATPALPPAERVPGTHWIGSWLGPRAGLDDMKD